MPLDSYDVAWVCPQQRFSVNLLLTGVARLFAIFFVNYWASPQWLFDLYSCPSQTKQNNRIVWCKLCHWTFTVRGLVISCVLGEHATSKVNLKASHMFRWCASTQSKTMFFKKNIEPIVWHLNCQVVTLVLVMLHTSKHVIWENSMMYLLAKNNPSIIYFFVLRLFVKGCCGLLILHYSGRICWSLT